MATRLTNKTVAQDEDLENQTVISGQTLRMRVWNFKGLF
jgi:hypothetical protein